MRRAVPGICQQTHPVRLGTARGPHLAPVYHVVVAIPDSRGGDTGDVRARANLRHAETRHFFAGDRRSEKLLAQFVRAKPRQRRCCHFGLHADGHRYPAATDPAQRFAVNRGVGIIESEAAVGFGFVDAEEPEVAHLAEQFMSRKPTFSFPVINVRIDFVVDEFLQRAAQFNVLFGQLHSRSFL